MSKNKLYDVYWTDLADESYADELDFIFKKWNQKEVIKFMDLVDRFTDKLKLGIVKGKFSKKSNIKLFVISKQTTVFFEINEKDSKIDLLLFWNNKQNPKKLKDLLKV